MNQLLTSPPMLVDKYIDILELVKGGRGGKMVAAQKKYKKSIDKKTGFYKIAQNLFIYKLFN